MMPRSKTQQHGFSLVELLVVMAVALVVMGFAVITFSTNDTQFKANAAQNAVLGQLRQARELAISRRHTVAVWFDPSIVAPDFEVHVAYQVQAVNGEAQTLYPVVTIPLGRSVSFATYAGLPDTPMQFGNLVPVEFAGTSAYATNAASAVTGFSSTGALVNPLTNQATSGTIFLGLPNKNASARAITILGATGRVRPYHWDGTAWQQ